MYLSTKTYGNDRGLSCVFRQWRADSYCHDWHGYALGFKFVFGASKLDDRNWVVDFGPGGVGKIKEWLEHMFDHTFLVAEDDPHLEAVKALPNANVRVIPAAGCEAVAKMAYDFAQAHINESTKGRCWVESVEVFEHGSNSAIYRGKFAADDVSVGSPHITVDLGFEK